eukprot:122802-Rhodomonas_salina.1
MLQRAHLSPAPTDSSIANVSTRAWHSTYVAAQRMSVPDIARRAIGLCYPSASPSSPPSPSAPLRTHTLCQYRTSRRLTAPYPMSVPDIA